MEGAAYIACGDVTDAPTYGELRSQLNELDDPGFVGRATLIDNGDGTVSQMVAMGGETGRPARGVDRCPIGGG